MTTHNTPWKTGRKLSTGNIPIEDSTGQVVCFATSSDWGYSDCEINPKDTEKHAQRIVQGVNACTGIINPDETISLVKRVISEICEDSRLGGQSQHIPHGLQLQLREALDKLEGKA